VSPGCPTSDASARPKNQSIDPPHRLRNGSLVERTPLKGGPPRDTYVECGGAPSGCCGGSAWWPWVAGEPSARSSNRTIQIARQPKVKVVHARLLARRLKCPVAKSAETWTLTLQTAAAAGTGAPRERFAIPDPVRRLARRGSLNAPAFAEISSKIGATAALAATNAGRVKFASLDPARRLARRRSLNAPAFAEISSKIGATAALAATNAGRVKFASLDPARRLARCRSLNARACAET